MRSPTARLTAAIGRFLELYDVPGGRSVAIEQISSSNEHDSMP
jgi:hypothetical protein